MKIKATTTGNKRKKNALQIAKYKLKLVDKDAIIVRDATSSFIIKFQEHLYKNCVLNAKTKTFELVK